MQWPTVPMQALHAPLSPEYAESLLNAVLLLDKDNNLRSASVVVSANPRAWFPRRAQASVIYYRSTLELPTITVVPQ